VGELQRAANPHDLARTLPKSSRCPSCGDASLLDYINATSDERTALGFAPEQYR
jgi:hypothetical protein